MGYYTRYTLEVIATGNSLPARVQKLKFLNDFENDEVMTEYGPMSEVMIRTGNVLSTEESMKWYDSRKDIERISKDYPHVTFILSGEGRENEVDLWKFYARNGKTEAVEARIVFDEPEWVKNQSSEEINLEKVN